MFSLKPKVRVMFPFAEVVFWQPWGLQYNQRVHAGPCGYLEVMLFCHLLWPLAPSDPSLQSIPIYPYRKSTQFSHLHLMFVNEIPFHWKEWPDYFQQHRWRARSSTALCVLDGDPQITSAWFALLLQLWSQIENQQLYRPASLLDNDVKRRQGRP